MTANNTDNEKIQTSPAVQKSLMTAGPTLHYSHDNVLVFWILSLLIYAAACVFWSVYLLGSFSPFDISAILIPDNWRLGSYLLRPLSIFEYPWQIAVLGLVMGMLAVAPPLSAQLLSFRYSFPYVLLLWFLANLPIFAFFVFISCIAAASRPLRFRSRFVSIALCICPQLFFWAYFGGLKNSEPLQWGFSFAPWVCAWLVAIVFAGIVLAIGHFTRYRPGLLWLAGLITVFGALAILYNKIGFDELAYQRYVAENDPEAIIEFRDRSITENLDATMRNPDVKRYFSNFFYPSEPVMLRDKLKEEIQSQLANDRWPFWFQGGEEMNFGPKRQFLLSQCELFIKYPKHWWMPAAVSKKLSQNRATSKRMPSALYYKALISETMPDLPMIAEKETLHFYNDYAHLRCVPIWYQLYEQFPQSSESIEARIRLATHLAGKKLFENARGLLREAKDMKAAALANLEKEQPQNAAASMFASFVPPASSVMTAIKLTEIGRRIDELEGLISAENYTEDGGTQSRLAKFVLLNPHALDYPVQLDALISQTSEKDPLRDNLLFAKIKLIKDWQLQSEQLKALNEKYKSRDGGIAAMYELALLKVRLSQENTSSEQKKKYLSEAHETLESFIAAYPQSRFTEGAKRVLDSMPH